MSEQIVNDQGFKAMILGWTSDGSGNATLKTRNNVNGAVCRVETKPGAATPTSYDVTLKNDFGTDIAAGAITGRSTTANEGYDIDPPVPVTGPLTLGISSAGASKTGEVMILVYEF